MNDETTFELDKPEQDKPMVPAVRTKGALVPHDPFYAYLQEVRKYPALTEEEEKELQYRAVRKSNWGTPGGAKKAKMIEGLNHKIDRAYGVHNVRNNHAIRLGSFLASCSVMICSIIVGALQKWLFLSVYVWHLQLWLFHNHYSFP